VEVSSGTVGVSVGQKGHGVYREASMPYALRPPSGGVGLPSARAGRG